MSSADICTSLETKKARYLLPGRFEVFELVKFANTNVQEGSSKEFAGHTLEVMTKLCDVLGLTLEKKEEILDEEIENLIAERQAARKAKDFARADEIRGLLLDKGIELKDTREGVKWKRI